MDIKNFYNQRILFVVPHQDDEINLAGQLILSLSKKSEIYILYTTNGSYLFPPKVRKKEAIRACKKLGIKKENIIFLDYPDQPYDKDSHMYNCDGNWIDKNGNTYNKNNLINDIKYNIEQISPNIIFCIDLDFHPDHIMTSLCTEKAIGEILKDNTHYKPQVYKGFAYENAFYGPDDMNLSEYKKMNINYDSNGLSISNPYYSKNNSIEVVPDNNTTTRKIQFNKAYKAIRQHKSQVLAERAFRIINPNLVFWKRETDNLIYKSSIKATSGDASFLQDFLINDTSNVLHGDKNKIIFDKSIWIPDENDTKKEIYIHFKEAQSISTINIYHGNNGKTEVSKIHIVVKGKIYTPSLSGKISSVSFKENVKTKDVAIKILDKKVENGFSEIEILQSRQIEQDHQIDTNKIRNKLTKLQKILNRIIKKTDTIISKIYRKIIIVKG